jgi:hexosaminidase
MASLVNAISVCCLLGLVAAPVHAEHRPLLPRPQQVKYASGSVPLADLAIGFDGAPDEQDVFAIQQLVAGLSSVAHLKVLIPAGSPSSAGLILHRTSHGPDLPTDNEVVGHASREAYTISVTKVHAEISASSSAGLFYGIQTLLQMVEFQDGQAVLPVVEVKDWPTLPYRGFMMDFSEGQLLRVSEIERQLDLLARFKGNQYYFYSELAIAWKGYDATHIDPDSRFTPDQVRHIINYAKQRHIDVVPCMELYGHMHQLFRTEQYADVGLPRYGEEFDPRNPRALQVIDDLFDQATTLFGSPWCHVGFDEPWSLGKIGMTPGRDPFLTFVEYLQHLADRAQGRGKRMLYWADVENPTSTLRTHPDLIAKLPRNAISGPWQYDALTNFDPYVKPLADAGLPTLVTPAIFNWNEIFPDYHHTFVNINGMVATGKKYKTLGVINTGWTDCAQTLYRESWPGIAFGAIAGWQSEPVNTNSFFADYTAVMDTPEEAPEVAAALEELSGAEELFERITDNPTQHAFWKDPLQPELLARLEKHEEPCRKARLLAEAAEEHLSRAQRLAPRDPTLNSLMMAARLFDYLGMKCLYAVEWDGYFKQLQAHPDEKLFQLYISIQLNQQGNGMLADLTDAITGMRDAYRDAWLEESTPYRLNAALALWDAETRFWLDTKKRTEQLLRSHKKGEPFPSIDAIRAQP